MKILSWNCRGLRSIATIHSLHKLIQSTKPTIIFLSETHLTDPIPHLLTKTLRDYSFTTHHRSSHSGGLLLAWDSSIPSPSIHSSGDNLIQAFFPHPLDLHLFSIYGPHTHSQKHIFWESLESKILASTGAILVTGDLNSVIFPSDKLSRIEADRQDCTRMQNFLHSTGLIDLLFQGPGFTWSNNRTTLHHTRERLDRSLASHQWITKFPNSRVLHLPPLHSDHAPILTTTESTTSPTKSFRFENAWLLYGSFLPTVERHWQSFPTSLPLHHKLSSTSICMKTWAQKYFRTWKHDLKKASANLQRCLQLPPSTYRLKQATSIRAQIHFLESIENTYWKQRAKTLWDQHGDNNSRHFHICADSRRRRNHISIITAVDGTTLSEPKDIIQCLNSHMQKIMAPGNKTRQIPINTGMLGLLPTLSSTEQAAISCLPSLDEIRLALFSMGSNKAAGPDGLNNHFYKSSWPFIQHDLLSFVTSCWTSQSIPPDHNKTTIVLIPKKHQPLSPNDYRPISLTNTTYKIIMKILSNRMKPFLSKLLTPFQSAFLSGKMAADNIIIAQEAVHTLKTRPSARNWMLLKLDMEKAFDRMEWDFLHQVLQLYGFPTATINLIMNAIQTSSMSLLVNGQHSPPFKPTRGLRQGCPLSPYLFNLGTNILSTLLHHSLNSNFTAGLHFSRVGPTLNHLLFADDTIIFVKGSVFELHKTKFLLDSFCEWSGQKINFHKSKVFMGNCVPIPAQSEIHHWGIRNMSPTDLYLGYPVFAQREAREAHNILLDKLRAQLPRWKADTLSQAGRTTLIQSVLCAIPQYIFQNNLLPKTKIQELEKVIRDFWWGYQDGQRHLYTKSWSYLQHPKHLGGIGIPGLHLMNMAYIMKLVWRLSDPNEQGLWKQVMLAKYKARTGFWDSSLNRTSSPLWKSIHSIKSHVFPNLQWSVGNGNNINTWRDSWIRGHDSHTHLSLMNARTAPPTVDGLIQNGSWNVEAVTRHFPPDIHQDILQTPITGTNDQLIWKPKNSGKFTIKSAYTGLILHHQQNPNSLKDINRSIWHTPTIKPKVRLTVWKAVHDCLPTRSTLHMRLPNINPLCPMCQEHPETTDHLFLHCPHAQLLWSWIKQTCYGPIPQSLHQTILEITHSPDKNMLPRTMAAIWAIWNNRCKTVFRQAPINSQDTLASAMAISLHRHQCPNTPLHPIPIIPYHQLRQPPTNASFIIHTDASHFHTFTTSSAVLLSPTNTITTITTNKSINLDICQAEARAVLDGLIAWANHIAASSRSVIVTDNLTVYKAIHNEIEIPWKAASEIVKIKELLMSFPLLSLHYVPREDNSVADLAAKFARASNTFGVWPTALISNLFYPAPSEPTVIEVD